MMDKRRILEAVLNGDSSPLNQLPPTVLFFISDNHRKGVFKVKPPHGQSLPGWAKAEMSIAEIEAVKAKYHILPIIIEKTYE